MQALEPRTLLALLMVGSTGLAEGNSGTTDAVFPVTLYQPSDKVVTVKYATADGSAVAPADYEPVSGTLTFEPGGARTQNVVVHLKADTLQEENEWFQLQLTDPTNATLPSYGSAAIADVIDEDTSFVSVPNVAVLEGDAGTTDAVFTVTRSGSTAGTSTVDFAAIPFRATSPEDFLPTSGTLTFAPGEASKSIVVPVVGDAIAEADADVYTVLLTNPVNTTLLRDRATGAVLDDDYAAVSIEGGVVGDSNGSAVPFTIRRYGQLASTVTLGYQTFDRTAVAGVDYVRTVGSVTFAPGETEKVVAVPVIADSVAQGAKTFALGRNNTVQNAVFLTAGQGVIVNSDEALLATNDVVVEEGSGGSGSAATFTVRRFGPLDGEATVQYATRPSSATAGTDYPVSSGTVAFAPGEGVKTISVPVVPDTELEDSEQIIVDLSQPTGAAIAAGRGTATIVDDDRSYVVMGGVGQAVIEGSAGPHDAEFTLTRYGSLAGTSTVTFDARDFIAHSPADFTASSRDVTFLPGEASKRVTVPIVGDTDIEKNEAFAVSISRPLNTIIPNMESGSPVEIVDDDASSITFEDAAAVEGDPGDAHAVVFTVRRFGSLDGRAGVGYRTIASNLSTATTGQDFTPVSGDVYFESGESSKTVTVPLVGDLTAEDPVELFVLEVGSGSALPRNAAVGIIVDDDAAPKVTDVVVGSTSWAGDDGDPAATTFGEYLQQQALGSALYGYALPGDPAQTGPLPWVNLNRVSVRFNKDVVPSRDALSVRGANGFTYDLLAGAAGFEYDSDARVATWTFSRNFRTDRLLLMLDGNWPGGVRGIDGTFLNGSWSSRFDVLPGDADRAASRVNALDLAYVRARSGRSVSQPPPAGALPYTPFADLNADGRINALDLAAVRQHLNDTLPDATAAMLLADKAALLTTGHATSALFSTEPVV